MDFEETSSTPKANILIIDDNLSNLHFLTNVLRQQGYTVCPITNGFHALSIVQKSAIDLILLDTNMSQINGYQICKLLKTKSGIKNIPVIFMSEIDELNNKVKAFKAGGVDYITKPFHTTEILIRVETHLRLSGMQKCLQAKNATLQEEITERINTEKALKTSEAELRALFTAITDLILVFDRTGCYLKISPFSQNLLYRPMDELLGKTLHEVFPKDKADFFLAAIQQCIDTQQPVNIEYDLFIEGEQTWFDGKISAISTQSAMLIARNITARKCAEEALRKSEQKLSHHFQHTPLGVIEWNLRGEVVEWNSAAERIFGFSKQEVINCELINLIVPRKQRILAGKIWSDLLSGRNGTRSTNENVTKAGKIIICEWYNTTLVDVDGHVMGVASLVHDITESKKAEDELRESEHRLAETQKLAHLGSWELDPLTNTMQWSAETFRITGLTKQINAITLEYYLQIIHPEDVPLLQEKIDRALTKKEAFEIEIRHLCEKDIYNHTLMKAQPITKYGKVIKLLGSLLDITSRKRAEEALQQRNQELLLLNRVSQMLSVSLDLDKVLSMVLDEMRQLLNVVATSFWLYVPQTGELVCQQANGPAYEQVRGWRLKPGQGIAGWVFLNQQSLIVPDAWQDARHYRGVTQKTKLAVRSILSIPLWVKGKVIGALNLVDTAINRFSIEDLVLLEPIAAAAANAIENAHLYTVMQQELAERKRAEKALQESEKCFRTLMEQSPISIEIYDLSGTQIQANKAYEELWGIDRNLTLGSFNILTDPQIVRKGLFSQFSKAFTGETVFLEGVEWDPRESGLPGRKRWLSTRIYPLKDDQDKVLDVVITHEDITERKGTEEALKKAKEIAEIASKAKSDFLANISHELRTPLNIILGNTQMLKHDQDLINKYGKSVDAIHRSGEHLLLMINDILDLSKIEANKLELLQTNFHLPIFLNTLVDMLQIRAQQKGILLKETIATDLPTIVCGDEKHLRQVLFNLLGNAIKFTHKGQVTLRVETVNTQSTTQKSAHIRFQVEDTGIGISAEKLEEIFLPFTQLDSFNQHAEGSGLGLTISQRLIHLMGSELKVKSTLGKGSLFWFDLEMPCILDGMIEPTTIKQANIVGFHGNKRKILIVDDKIESREILKNLLSPLGFRLAEATNGQEALIETVQFCPDLILLDLLMPIMDGFEFLRQVKQQDNLTQAIIIIVSACASCKTQQELKTLGSHDFITKPIQIDKLLLGLKKYLKLEWIYLQVSKPEIAPIVHESTTLLIPPQSMLEKLCQLTKKHHISGIREFIVELNTNSPEYTEFTQHIGSFLDKYRFKELLECIQSFLKE